MKTEGIHTSQFIGMVVDKSARMAELEKVSIILIKH